MLKFLNAGPVGSSLPVAAAVLFAVAALLSLGGCGTSLAIENERPAEQVVAERAQARWDALLAGDLESAYQFNTPAYRASKSLGRYRGDFGGAVSWVAASVDSVACEGSRCEAVVMLTYRLPRERLENTRPMRETWISSDGQWWFFTK